MNGLALCAGLGGLELGVRIATRGRHRVVGYVEREAYAAAALVARMEDAALDRAPVWDDLTTFDGAAWRGLVDCLTVGLPCQPYSLIGQKRGHADERALWPEFVRIVAESEPGIIFGENVSAFLKHFGPVWERLRAMGYVFAPALIHTAAEIGGPHGRPRFFFLAAHPDRARLEGYAGDEHRSRYPGARPSRPTSKSDRAVANADRIRRQSEWGGWVFDCERQTLRHDADRCRPGCGICGSHWETESPPVRMDHGFSERLDQLHAIGNAVAPDVAASAWTYLMEQLVQQLGATEERAA